MRISGPWFSPLLPLCTEWDLGSQIAYYMGVSEGLNRSNGLNECINGVNVSWIRFPEHGFPLDHRSV